MAEGQRQETPIAETLREWLPTKAKAGAFVAYLGSAGRALEPDDLSASLEMAHGEVRALGRVGELLKASTRASPNLQAGFQRFAQRVLAQERPTLSDWLKDEHSSAEADLEVLSKEFASDLRSKDAAVRKKAEALLAIGLAIFTAKRHVSPDLVLRSIEEAYGSAVTTSPSDMRPVRAASALIAGSKPRQLRQFAQIARLYVHRAAQAEAGEQQALGRATTAEKSAAECKEQLRKREEELAQARAEAAQLERQLQDTTKRLGSAQSVGAHDLAGLRARYRRVLGESIEAVLRNALDALEVDPPRPDFAKTYLNEVLEKIERELQWLNERSD